MPTGKSAIEFFERLATLETKVDSLMSDRKWIKGFLVAILIVAFTAAMK